MLSDTLAAKLAECKKELGFTDDLTDADYLIVAKHLVKNYPESIDMANPADRMFQSISGP